MAVTVLIVEDEEKIGRFLELELRHEGYEVLKAHDGREGLELALSGKADLMVLDIMLPELNGFEVLRRLRKNSDMPVIMLTARDEVMDKVAGLDGGADRFYRADTVRSSKTGGTGLGLSIAKWIVDKHGGYYDILSRERIGTRFDVVFPSIDI